MTEEPGPRDPSPRHDDAQQTGEGPVEELLVEEVSIDGMCGVY